MGELVVFFDLTPGFISWEVLADLGLISSFCVRVFAIYSHFLTFINPGIILQESIIYQMHFLCVADDSTQKSFSLPCYQFMDA